MNRIGLAGLSTCALVAAGCAGEKAEGRPWVHQVQIAGVKSVKAKEIVQRLQVEQTNWLHYPKKYLDPFTVDIDRQRIEAYYRTHGYFNARVTSADVTPVKGDKDKPTAVDVKFTVDEGLPTKIEAVQLDGLDAVKERDKLTREFAKAVKPGVMFDHQKYLDAKGALVDALKHLGYAWPKVDGRVEVNRDTRAARVVVKVAPGVIAHFSHVHVDGLSRVAEHRVALHAGIMPGDPFSPDALEDARGRIYNLGVFSSVQVEYVQDEHDPTKADVLVHVHEGTFNDLRIGLGVGLESQRTDAHASLVYQRRNWLGALRTLRLRLEPAWVAIPAFWSIDRTGPAIATDATLTQPDWPCQLCVLKFVLGFDVGIEYAYQYYGPRTSLGLTRGFWRERLMLGASYNFQLLEFFNADPTFTMDPATAGRLYGFTIPYRLGWWQEDFVLDLRDKPLGAHQGGYFGLSLEQGGEYAAGAFQYEKITPDVRGYAPLGSRVTLAGRFQFGQLFTQGAIGSPVTRRYYLGGPNSHRGFNYNRLSQQVPSGLPGVAPLPIGGDQMVLMQVELRVDVLRLFGQWLSVAAFLDAGDVGGPDCGSSCGNLVTPGGVQWTDLHYAVGGGLRYRTVIGTIRFDLGVRLNRLTPFEPDGTPNPDPGQRFAFHISVGEAF
jgi:translocation and assembly module TamA